MRVQTPDEAVLCWQTAVLPSVGPARGTSPTLSVLHAPPSPLQHQLGHPRCRKQQEPWQRLALHLSGDPKHGVAARGHIWTDAIMDCSSSSSSMPGRTARARWRSSRRSSSPAWFRWCHLHGATSCATSAYCRVILLFAGKWSQTRLLGSAGQALAGGRAAFRKPRWLPRGAPQHVAPRHRRHASAPDRADPRRPRFSYCSPVRTHPSGPRPHPRLPAEEAKTPVRMS